MASALGRGPGRLGMSAGPGKGTALDAGEGWGSLPGMCPGEAWLGSRRGGKERQCASSALTVCSRSTRQGLTAAGRAATSAYPAVHVSRRPWRAPMSPSS